MFCTSCFTANPAHAKFCNACGKSLVASISPSVTSEPGFHGGTSSATDGSAVDSVKPPQHNRQKLVVIAVVISLLVIGVHSYRLFVLGTGPVKTEIGPDQTEAEKSDDAVAPSLANLEWVDQGFRKAYEDVSALAVDAKFKQYRDELDAFLIDSAALHEYGQAQYKTAINRDSADADRYSMVDIVSAVGIENASYFLKNIGGQYQYSANKELAGTAKWEREMEEIYSRWTKVLDAYSNSNAAISKYGEKPEVLRSLMLKGSEKLDESRALLKRGDALGSWISLQHAVLLIDTVRWRISGSEGFNGFDEGPGN